MAYTKTATRPWRLLDISGQRYGRLVATKLSGLRTKPNGKSATYWECRCDCGAVHDVPLSSLRSGKSKSCGCAPKYVKHGHARAASGHTSEYKAWARMKQRCLNPNNTMSRYYSGVSISPEWLDSFETFLADVGEIPGRGYSLDRIDPCGGYNKSNCRWATVIEQANNKRNTQKILWKDEWLTIAQIARMEGISDRKLRYLLNQGQPLIEAVTHLRSR